MGKRKGGFVKGAPSTKMMCKLAHQNRKNGILMGNRRWRKKWKDDLKIDVGPGISL